MVQSSLSGLLEEIKLILTNDVETVTAVDPLCVPSL